MKRVSCFDPENNIYIYIYMIQVYLVAEVVAKFSPMTSSLDYGEFEISRRGLTPY